MVNVRDFGVCVFLNDLMDENPNYFKEMTTCDFVETLDSKVYVFGFLENHEVVVCKNFTPMSQVFLKKDFVDTLVF
jgi:hypothetical protein